MRVVVTGATGAFGAPLCAELARRGADVVGLARREPERLPAGAGFVRGDVTDPSSIEPMIAGADVVVHLAWLLEANRDPKRAEALNLGGTRNVLDAMTRHGVGRLVFASSVMAYGSHADHPEPYDEDEPLRATLRYGDHKRRAEAEIADRGIPAVVVRPAAVLGRDVRNAVSDAFATPVLIGSKAHETKWQLAHQQDVSRFLADAATGTRTGTVNLAAADVVPLEEAGRLLGKRVVRLAPSTLSRAARALYALHLSEIEPAGVEALAAMPIADTSRLRHEWGFECAWSTRDTFVDARHSIDRYLVVGRWRHERRRPRRS